MSSLSNKNKPANPPFTNCLVTLERVSSPWTQPPNVILQVVLHTTIGSREWGSVLDAKHITERAKSPVFVMGCHRSGTNLLYDTLLSAGGFAVYTGYLPVHKILIPRFGPFHKLENR